MSDERHAQVLIKRGMELLKYARSAGPRIAHQTPSNIKYPQLTMRTPALVTMNHGLQLTWRNRCRKKHVRIRFLFADSRSKKLGVGEANVGVALHKANR